MKTLTEAQAKAFLKATWGSRFETLYWLALTTGLREGELLGLKWNDLDWTNRRLRIQRQLQRINGRGLIFSEPKSEAGKRSILLSSTIMHKLRGQRVIQSYEKLFAGDRWHDHDPIFPSTIGTPLDHIVFYRDFKGLLRSAELPNIRFHDIRHTAATLMLQQGIHPKVVQERLGHLDIALTLNTYSHVLPDIQKDAVEKMDHFLASAEASVASTTDQQHEARHIYLESE